MQYSERALFGYIASENPVNEQLSTSLLGHCWSDDTKKNHKELWSCFQRSGIPFQELRVSSEHLLSTFNRRGTSSPAIPAPIVLRTIHESLFRERTRAGT